MILLKGAQLKTFCPPSRDKTSIERHLAGIRFPIHPAKITKTETGQALGSNYASETSKIQVGNIYVDGFKFEGQSSAQLTF